MRVLIAPQEFKGTLTAREATEAIARGIARARPDWQRVRVPLADGGPGTVEAFLLGREGQRRRVTVRDPLGRPVEAEFALLDDGRAVLEMAQASGLWRLSSTERDALHTSTFGTGELVRAALDEGATSLLLGAGGSATNDGGAGALAALGVRLLDRTGAPLPPGGAALKSLATIEVDGLDSRLAHVPLEIATDVSNPLLGPEGATRIYARQKGANTAAIAILEDALTHFADVVERSLDLHVRDLRGAGAAGGLAFGLAAVTGARIVPGFEQIARALRLDAQLASADVVITGEGRVDVQTGYGKGPSALAGWARREGVPVVCLAGSSAPTVDAQALGFDALLLVSPEGPPPPDEAARRLEHTALQWASGWRVSPPGDGTSRVP